MSTADDVLQAVRADLDAGASGWDIASDYGGRAAHAGALDAVEKLCREYGATVDALADLRSANGGRPGPRRGRAPAGVVRLSEVEPERVRWLWPGRIPLGKPTLVDGDPGLGKSTMLIGLAARLSIGARMPDGSEPEVDGPAGTVLLTAEDGLGDTVRPRLDAAGGDPDRVAVLKHVPDGDPDQEPRLPHIGDTPDLAYAIQVVGARLLVVDPLMAFLPSDVNSHRDQDVRRALAPLAELAEETGVAVVAVRHLNKSGGSNPKYRGGGSIGLIGAARSALLVAEDPDAPDTRRILAPIKANNSAPAPSLAYTLQPTGNGAVRVSWEGEAEHGASDLLDRPTGEERTARDEAAHILREELGDGRRPVEELRHVADDLGVSWSTVERAKRRLGVESVREGFGDEGTWYWRLSEGKPEGEPHPSENGEAYGGADPSGPATGRNDPIDVRGGEAYGDDAEAQGDTGGSDPIGVSDSERVGGRRPDTDSDDEPGPSEIGEF